MTHPAEDLRILIVDDEPMSICLIVETLRDYGFDILTAGDGREALQRVRESRPDLILLDVRMPEMDGPTLCAQIKADPATAGIPVIFLTAQDDAECQLHSFRLGAIDYITKPFDPKVVLARVLLHLRQDRLRRNLEQRLAALERSAPPAIVKHGPEPGRTAPEIARGVERVARHLLDHLSDNPTLDELARLACTNRRTLNQEFQAAYSLSVFDWLREQRLSQAAALLGATDLDIVQIARQVGFTGYAGLSKAFRQRYGVSPGQYRKTRRA
jgi:CheY-like chemotaxis protein